MLKSRQEVILLIVKHSLVLRPKEGMEGEPKPEPVFVVSGIYKGDCFLGWDELSFVGLRFGNGLLHGSVKKTERGWKVKEAFRYVFDDRRVENFYPNVEELCSLAEKGLEIFEEKLRLLTGVKGTFDASGLVLGVITFFSEGNMKVKVECFGKEGKVVFRNFPVGSWLMSARFEKLEDWDLRHISLERKVKLQGGEITRMYFVDVERRYPQNARERIERLSGFLREELQALFESVPAKDFSLAKRIFDRISKYDLDVEGDVLYESSDGSLSVYASDDGRWHVKVSEVGKFSKDPQTASKLTRLVREVEETGQDEELLSFCKQMLFK